MSFRLGAKRSRAEAVASAADLRAHPDVRARLGAHYEERVALPDSVDLGGFEPPRFDQGMTESCVGHSVAGALYTTLAATGRTLGFVPSPRTIYAAARGIERARATPPGDALPRLQDTGSELADAIDVLARYGVRPMQAPTPDGRQSDLWGDLDVGVNSTTASNVNDEPNFQELEQSGERLIRGPYSVSPNADDADDVLRAALASGIAVLVATYVDSAFQQLAADAVAPAPNLADKGGGHAMYFSGYYMDSDGQLVTWVTSSWSGRWCMGGRARTGAAWRKAAWEVWPLVVNP